VSMSEGERDISGIFSTAMATLVQNKMARSK
jgi:hypothetical protein